MKETRNRGWWIPGGAVDFGETFEEAAKRECLEEAGMFVDLKGILKIDYGVEGKDERMRVIYYAEPKDIDEAHRNKQKPDKESIEARWVSLKELDKISLTEKIRGEELFEWGEYLEKGGHYYPCSIMGVEGQV